MSWILENGLDFNSWDAKVVERAFYVEWTTSLSFDTIITENVVVK